MPGYFAFISAVKPATRVLLVVLSCTPGSITTLPLPCKASPIASAPQRPDWTPGIFWKATKLSPTFQGL